MWQTKREELFNLLYIVEVLALEPGLDLGRIKIIKVALIKIYIQITCSIHYSIYNHILLYKTMSTTIYFTELYIFYWYKLLPLYMKYIYSCII